MKILILGAGSFIAQTFGHYMRARGHEVELSTARLRALAARGIPGQVTGRVVVNFAAKALVPQSWDTPLCYYQTNILDKIALVESLRRFKLGLWLEFSTPEVYGSTENYVTEDHPFRPTSPYAISRAAFDSHLMAMHRRYRFPAIITRACNVYGPGQAEYRLIPRAIRCKLAGESFPLEGGGTSLRSFLHVEDVARALETIIECSAMGETYHISSYPVCSVRSVVEKIGCEFHIPRGRGEDAAYRLDDSKLRRLGWTPQITFSNGLAQTERSICESSQLA